MQVSNQSCLERTESLKTTLGRIQATLKLNDATFRDFFEITQQEYQMFQQNVEQIPLSKLDRLSTRLNLDLFQLLNGNIDYHSLYKSHYKRDLTLPTKYTHHKKSRIKTAANILHYLDNLFPGYSDIIANKLQISWASLTNPFEQVNASLIDDIYSLMGVIGFQTNDLINCGISNAINYYYVPEFASPLWKENSPQPLLDRFFNEQINYIDGTWHYEILKLTNNHCQVKVTTRKSAQEIYHVSNFGCQEQCAHRLGFGIGLLRAALNKTATYHESKCVHQGHDYCQLEIFY